MKLTVGIGTFLGFLTFTLCLCAVPASATTVSFELDFIFSGPGEPTNTVGPWVTAVFSDVSTDTVDLTISAPGMTGDTEKVSAMYFNLDPSLDVTLLNFSSMITSDNVELSMFGIGLGDDAHQANGDGHFDILIDFNKDGESKAFNEDETVQFTITLAGLTAESFNFPSTMDGGEGEYSVAGHLLSVGVGEDSAWITVPEPATIALLGLGALALLRKRRA